MNTRSLIDLVKRRIPGYQDSEYLSELNDAYSDVFESIVNLDNSWFEDVIIVTVAAVQDKFDLLFNTDSGLNTAVSPLLQTIKRIRVLAPNNSNGAWQIATPKWINSESFLRQQEASPAQTQTTGVYRYRPFSKGVLQFGMPLAIGTQIEIVFTYSPLPLAFISDGTVSKSSKTVTGTSSHFTDILPPDFKVEYQPGVSDYEAEVSAEIVVDSRTFRVDAIASDTSLTTFTVIPTIVTNTYSLSVVPDIPPAHHRVIASIATANMLSTPADDERFSFWAQKSQAQKETMLNALRARQEQANPRRRPFRYRGYSPNMVITAS